MTNSRLLSLFLILLTAPAVGLFFFLGFIGSLISGLTAAAVMIIIMIWGFEPSKKSHEAIRADVLFFSLSIALALCLLGGEGRVFFSNYDWLIRDPIINDLVSQPWPFVYQIDASHSTEQIFILRAPLAMYMLPAAVGKIFGVYAAHLALLAQNTILFGLIFYFIVPACLRIWPSMAAILTFAMFSGLDVVPVAAKHILIGQSFGDHLEWWAGLFQYSSNITQLFWVPHHAIAGWAFACLYLLWLRGNIRVTFMACAFLYLAYWSPLAVIGAGPFVAYAALSDLLGGKISRFDLTFLFLAALPAIPLWIYLIQGGGSVEHHFLVGTPNFWKIYFVFIFVEFIPFVALIVAAKPTMIRDRSFLIVVISLLLIPFYKLGVSNDFAMRASIPALALLAAYFSIMLAKNATSKRFAWTSIATLILFIGSVTGFMEIRRALIRPPLPISGCNFVQAWEQSPFAQIPLSSYLVTLKALPEWMRPQSPFQVPTGSAGSCFT